MSDQNSSPTNESDRSQQAPSSKPHPDHITEGHTGEPREGDHSNRQGVVATDNNVDTVEQTPSSPHAHVQRNDRGRVTDTTEAPGPSRRNPSLSVITDLRAEGSTSGVMVWRRPSQGTTLPSISSLLSAIFDPPDNPSPTTILPHLPDQYLNYALAYDDLGRREAEPPSRRFDYSTSPNVLGGDQHSLRDGIPPPGLLFQEGSRAMESEPSLRMRDSAISQDAPLEHFRRNVSLYPHVTLPRRPMSAPLPERPTDTATSMGAPLQQVGESAASILLSMRGRRRVRKGNMPTSPEYYETARAAQRRMEARSGRSSNSPQRPSWAPSSSSDLNRNASPGPSNILPMRSSVMEPPQIAMPTPVPYGHMYSMTPSSLISVPYHARQPTIPNSAGDLNPSMSLREPEGGRITTGLASLFERKSRRKSSYKPTPREVDVPVECPIPQCNQYFTKWRAFICHMVEHHGLNAKQNGEQGRCPLQHCPFIGVLTAQHVIRVHSRYIQ